MAAGKRAPDGDLTTYTRERFAALGMAHDVYRKGAGPAVLVITEIPGITPHVVGFADRVVELGCTAVLPDLFGQAGRDADSEGLLSRNSYMGGSIARACISREFTIFATGRHSPAVDWLRELAKREHVRCGGPGVGVVGMCFTGGFALAMAADPVVLAPVLSQPSLPVGLSSRTRAAIDCSAEDLARVKARCEREQLQVLGLRFRGDPLVPKERFAFLREQLGEAFISVELDQTAGHPDSHMPRAHSVLTRDLIDEPGQPTRAALDRVLALFEAKLLAR